MFRERERGDELAFERRLWSQLQRLHDLDARYHPWDPRVSDDPESPKFSFSVAGDAFFVIGMHPGASRSARRFAWPTLVFNAHEQFENLRADGRFEPLQSRIRERELRLDGRINPNLADYGYHSEARQYSGRPTEPDVDLPVPAAPLTGRRTDRDPAAQRDGVRRGTRRDARGRRSARRAGRRPRRLRGGRPARAPLERPHVRLRGDDRADGRATGCGRTARARC